MLTRKSILTLEDYYYDILSNQPVISSHMDIQCNGLYGARSINDFYCEDQKQNKFIQYLFNHQSTIANVLKMMPLLLVFSSFVLVIVSMGSSLETTQWMIAIYFVVTMINLFVNGLVMTLFKRN